MDILLIGLAAFSASLLTFFSGFGLGTVLMPVFLIFFPLNTAIALTAVVHFLNNFLKLSLLWKNADVSVVKRFGLPAVLSAIAGAAVLFWLQKAPPLYAYSLQGRELTVTPLKIVLAVLMAFFVFLESVPAFQKSGLPPKFLPVGGVLSGFFGGLSGHQGALRSLFLLKCGLSKERFLATGVVIACLVDLSRLAVYQRHLRQLPYETYLLPMMVSVACAFAGVFLANRLLQKITMKTIQRIVSVLVLLIALLLAAGIV